MAGSGIDSTNAQRFKEIGVDAIHFTARKNTGNILKFDMGKEYIADTEKIKSIMDIVSH